MLKRWLLTGSGAAGLTGSRRPAGPAPISTARGQPLARGTEIDKDAKIPVKIIDILADEGDRGPGSISGSRSLMICETPSASHVEAQQGATARVSI